MSIRKEDAYKHVLCMDLQTNGLRYAVLSKDSKQIVHHRLLTFDTYERDAIQTLLTDEELFYDYDSLVATVGGNRSTLMPVDLFNHSSAKDIFKLNYPAPIDNLDYNRIPELGIVNIYELPLWIKSMFVIKFPRVKLVHPATVLLKGVLNKSPWSPKVHVYMTGDSFYMLITDKSKLEYFNRFDQTNLSDMVYHILFVLEQKEMEQEKMEMCVYGVSAEWQQKNEMQEFFKNPIQISDKKEEGEQFVLANQLLCV